MKFILFSSQLPPPFFSDSISFHIFLHVSDHSWAVHTAYKLSTVCYFAAITFSLLFEYLLNIQKYLRFIVCVCSVQYVRYLQIAASENENASKKGRNDWVHENKTRWNFIG